MARYLILIHGDEQADESATQADFDALMAAHNAFSAKHGPAILGGEALQSTKTATSIRSDGTITDGPFAEVKEALGGYYLVQAADLDEAIAIAKDCPAPNGGVEVRPIMEFE
ncbi:MAG: hypothetical protein HOU81_06780 [Hamadaea sp.]|uniref:YciI family protein n=1 Tax=Hamadaea sp. TaxID=2024425 RepID=UPI0017EF0D33|nr:YciI family protein [Hamadaea sp.]NUR70506.1 hypothetical protein [Hamadaea sp.]NUT18113.1 hypothetical protein [Hamadaea sp.]